MAQRGGELSSPTFVIHPGDSWTRIASPATRRALPSTSCPIRVRRSVRLDFKSYVDHGVEAKRSSARTNTPSSHGTNGQLYVGGAGAHPDELPLRVMTTHPAVVNAGTRSASGGAVEARKDRTDGQGCARPGSVRQGTRSSGDGANTTLVAEIPDVRDVTGSSRRSVDERGRTPFSYGPCLTRAGGGRPPRVSIPLAMAGP